MIRFEEGGWWFPDGEAHLQSWILQMRQPCYGRFGYQKHKYDAAMTYVRNNRVAVDVGAHVGLWSWPLAWEFETVHSFEPMAAHRACFRANMMDRPNAILHDCALGAEAGFVSLRTRTADSSGDTGVEPDGQGERVPLRTLDSFELPVLDFLKIDCEGYELFVLKGARETLLRCKPVVVCEQKAETGGAQRYGIGVTDGAEYLMELGARRRQVLQGDYIMSWD